MRIDAIDLGYLDVKGAACAFVVASDGNDESVTLIETGPAACFATLERELERVLNGRTVGAILVTHIHLDHAGSVGHVLASHLVHPSAVVHVHPLGARHLVDPSRLVESSRRVHGATFERHYGEPKPCRDDRVRSADPRKTLTLGSLRATPIPTPGHAAHHYAWLVENRNESVAFTGDVLGMVVAELDGQPSGFISIPMPPNQFNRPAWRGSFAELLRRRPSRIALTHGGLVSASGTESAAYVERASARFEEEAEFVVALLRDLRGGSDDESDAIRRYVDWLGAKAGAAGLSRRATEYHLGPRFCRMNLDGVRRWLETASADRSTAT